MFFEQQRYFVTCCGLYPRHLQLFRVLNVRIALVDVITWNAGNQISVVSNPLTLLNNFRTYKPQITTQHDAAMLLTWESHHTVQQITRLDLGEIACVYNEMSGQPYSKWHDRVVQALRFGLNSVATLAIDFSDAYMHFLWVTCWLSICWPSCFDQSLVYSHALCSVCTQFFGDDLMPNSSKHKHSL